MAHRGRGGAHRRRIDRVAELEAALQEAQATGDQAAFLVATLAFELEDLRPSVENGDADAFLRALETVSHPGMVMPNWLGQKLGRGVGAYRQHRARTLDEAFGLKRPAQYRQKANRERWAKAPLIVHDAFKLHARGVPFGARMFEVLGTLHGTGSTRASEYFYYHKTRQTITYWVAEQMKEAEMRPQLAEALSKFDQEE